MLTLASSRDGRRSGDAGCTYNCVAVLAACLSVIQLTFHYLYAISALYTAFLSAVLTL